MNLPFSQKATDCNQTEAGAGPLVLEIRGLGPVPSLKNSKRTVIQEGGKAKPITSPKVKKWMQTAVAHIASQCLSDTPIIVAGTQTAHLQPFWTALLPRDDCWTVIPEINIRCTLCAPGDEGATITIERL